MKFEELFILFESEETRTIKNGEIYKHFGKSGNIIPKTKRVKELKTVYVDKNNFIHRLDGPAVLVYEPSTKRITYTGWFKHGKMHRLDGPAREGDITGTQYWINGKQYTKEEFEKYVNGIVNKDDLNMLGDLGQSFE